jgi:hypothetical protein
MGYIRQEDLDEMDFGDLSQRDRKCILVTVFTMIAVSWTWMYYQAFT